MIQQYLGIPTDYVVIGLCGIVLVLIILLIINMVKSSSLKKKYKIFMSGKDGISLEDSLIRRLEQVDDLVERTKNAEDDIDLIFARLQGCFQRFGMIKYDAFQEMGGKISFAFAMLDERNNGFIMNVVHSREGCYCYVKDIIDANSVVTLSEEEEEALRIALEEKA